MHNATARDKAAKFVERNLRQTLARRPPKGQRVFAIHNGKTIWAENSEELEAKILRRIQRDSRIATKH
jgi:hypothetical protein